MGLSLAVENKQVSAFEGETAGDNMYIRTNWKCSQAEHHGGRSQQAQSRKLALSCSAEQRGH